MAGTVARLGVTAEERARARAALLTMLTGETEPRETRQLVYGVVQLGVTAEGGCSSGRRCSCGSPTKPIPGVPRSWRVWSPSWIRLRRSERRLGRPCSHYSPAKPIPGEPIDALGCGRRTRGNGGRAGASPGDTANAPHRRDRSRGVPRSWAAVARLDPSAQEPARTRAALLTRLTGETDSWRAHAVGGCGRPAGSVGAGAGTGPGDAAPRLASETNSSTARQLLDAVIQLAVTVEERARAQGDAPRVSSQAKPIPGGP